MLWQKLSSAADVVGKKLGVGENTAGIFQKETSEEINVYEHEVKTWHCNWAALGAGGKTKATGIANKIYTHVKNNFGYTSNIDEDYLIGLCKPLSANMLAAVAIQFGVKDINNGVGMTSFTGHIFHLFDTILEDNLIGGKDLTSMKQVWSKTGLWL